MNVLHVIDSGGFFGAERVLVDLMAAQLDVGDRPRLLSLGGRTEGPKAVERECEARGVSCVPVRLAKGPNLRGGLRVLREARAWGASVLHSHGYKGNILIAMLPRRFRPCPVVSTVHGWTGSKALVVSRIRLYQWVDQIALRQLDGVVTVSEGMRTHPAIRRLRQKFVSTVPNGIRLSELSTAARNPAIEEFCCGGFVFGTVGRLSQEKGFDILLRAFAGVTYRRDDARLVVLGEGPQRDRLRRLIQRLGLSERVLMPGYTSARAHLPLFDVFVMPSWSEGLPVSLLESMDARKPVIATRVGGIPEALEDGELGVLVEPGDVGALRTAMEEAMLRNTIRQDQLDRAAERVSVRFSDRVMAAGYRRVYERMVRDQAAISDGASRSGAADASP